jgi:hypothetical protein
VFEAVISWINYEKETRLDHMAKLMEHVRLPLLPRDYLVQVSVCELTQPEEHEGSSGCVVWLRHHESLWGWRAWTPWIVSEVQTRNVKAQMGAGDVSFHSTQQP